MKKWITLLLCGLLCWCAAGAMAEMPLSLDNDNQIAIYPNGYLENGKGFVSYTGPYVITGTSNGVDTCLDFHSIPYGATQAAGNVTYTVTFKDVSITAGPWNTAIRFGLNDNNGKNITLNLINIGTSSVQSGYNHAVFSNQSSSPQIAVNVNIHNTKSSSLKLQGGKKGEAPLQTEWDVAGSNVTVNIGADKTIDTDHNVNSYTIVNSYCSLGDEHPAVPPCTTQGNVAYQQCSTCGTYAISINGAMTSVLPESVFHSAQGHNPVKVEGEEPTCTEDGHIEHWKCTRANCGKLFADANGTKELTADNVRLPAQHITQKVEAKTPTTEADGHIEHYLCTRCKALFADEKATTELTADEVILPKLVRTDSLPQTGDSSHLLRWMAVLLGACVGVMAVRSRRRG